MAGRKCPGGTTWECSRRWSGLHSPRPAARNDVACSPRGPPSGDRRFSAVIPGHPFGICASGSSITAFASAGRPFPNCPGAVQLAHFGHFPWEKRLRIVGMASGTQPARLRCSGMAQRHGEEPITRCGSASLAQWSMLRDSGNGVRDAGKAIPTRGNGEKDGVGGIPFLRNGVRHALEGLTRCGSAFSLGLAAFPRFGVPFGETKPVRSRVGQARIPGNARGYRPASRNHLSALCRHTLRISRRRSP